MITRSMQVILFQTIISCDGNPVRKKRDRLYVSFAIFIRLLHAAMSSNLTTCIHASVVNSRSFCADASQISKLVPDISLSAEREGHAHNFSCSGAGSGWVARHVTSLVKSQISEIRSDSLHPILIVC
ncbi:hypothetical protein OIU85_000594 [Salix viminalis]|uniref:Uncharacterized protein n=1 Tax=Salix viminalis TaxID=40686 RepID=A0A9Q0ZX34_SALVM|nr:hypothetical protein OIU85_000594 [Salix viminalis]